ncbi:hypothetical protein [Micromonospora sp. NBS 11-29]|uniref:hypothetical protein n=1 Tax=Micromonospora sp. NBS 11-29 TaxID=1960879 RepID=UPI000B7758BB|nr:hypothetical protein [Micromonospora sp. NBS 11-29]
MRVKPALTLLALALAAATLPGCGGDPADPSTAPATAADTSAAPVAGAEADAPTAPPSARTGLGRAAPSPKPTTVALRTGNPDGKATVPAEARAVDTSRPTRTVGSGTAASCTSAAVVKAVAAGGIITFDCGPAPVTITMKATAKVVNAHGPRIVLDGGGKVTLSGGGSRRILYLNTCDPAQGFTTSHCQNQEFPQLTVQNLTFTDGNSTGETIEGGGGGAIFVRGGRVKVVNSRFVDNRCDRTGPDLGGAALRVLSQFENKPVYVVNSTFTGGVCANGAALSSIGVSWTVLNSVFRDNRAVGTGANPARGGTPGGGSGGAIYCDGNTFTVTLAGTVIEGNSANEGGGAVFFVSNDRTGTMSISSSTLRRNPSRGFETKGFPGIFFLGAHPPSTTSSHLS